MEVVLQWITDVFPIHQNLGISASLDKFSIPVKKAPEPIQNFGIPGIKDMTSHTVKKIVLNPLATDKPTWPRGPVKQANLMGVT
jgi:hypothetical protein